MWRIKAIIQPSISLQNNLLTQKATKSSGQEHNHSNLNIPWYCPSSPLGTSSESPQIYPNQENLLVCYVLLVLAKTVFNDGHTPRPSVSLPYSNFFVTNCERLRKASVHPPSHRRLQIEQTNESQSENVLPQGMIFWPRLTVDTHFPIVFSSPQCQHL